MSDDFDFSEEALKRFIKDVSNGQISEAMLHRCFIERAAVVAAGELVRDIRKLRCIDIKELAGRVNMPEGRLVAIEAGVTADGPSIGELAKLSLACNYRVIVTAERLSFLHLASGTAKPAPKL